MLDEKLFKEETERLMNIISEFEEKMRLDTEIKLTETENIALDRAKLRLSEIEKADKNELQRIINDSIEADEGLFPKEKFKEIKKE